MLDNEFGDLYTDVFTSFTNSPSLPVQTGVSMNKKTDLTPFNEGGSDSHQELKRVELNEPARVLKIDRNVHLPNNQEVVFDDPNLVDESLIDVIEEDHAGDVVIGDSVITGLAIPEVIGSGGVLGEGDSHWNDGDSESDDELLIVLNDYNAGRKRDGEGVDGGGNVLVVKDEPTEGLRMEDQVWHGEGGMLQGRNEDGERKGLGDSSVNVNQVVQVQPPNIGVGYNNQLHSHFEYMRPGAAPLGGLVRPPLIVGPPPGHGRGDYRPEGLRIAPPTHKGYGMPVWTNNMHGSGRGLDFTLPSHKLHTCFILPRKRDRSNEMGPRHRSKVREIGRNDVDQYQLRKQLDNESWRDHDRFMGSRHPERDDNLKVRIDNLDDLHGKRRKEDIHSRRDLGEKEELLHVRREISGRQNRERDDIMEQRKRDDISRIRNNDQHSMKHKEEIWFPRERADRQRDDRQRLKRSHEETQSKREREDVPAVKNGRTGEEKSRNSYSRVKDELIPSDREYHLKDPGYHSEQHRRKDRMETESLSRHRVSVDIYSRGTRPSNYERRFRQERPSARNDSAVDVSGHQRIPEKKCEEYFRKRKESDEDYNSMVPSKMNRDDHYSQISEQVKMRVMMEQESGDRVIPLSHQSFRKRKKDASSDDEQHELMRGRSKSERWTSHKERDVNALTKSSSLNVKNIDEHKKIGTLEADTVPDESLKVMETGQNPHSLASKRDAVDQVNKDGEVKTEGNHLDSAKLKKLSERFHLPITSEKELGAVRQMENEQAPPVQTESHTESRTE